jgi:hypothetical protein
MKFEKQVEQFMELRIEGKSFDEIATTLKTSKQSLIDWNKQLQVKDTIKEGKALKINAVVKSFQFDLENRLNTYLELSQRINAELLQRDLTTIATDTLLKMSIANDNRVKDLLSEKVIIGQNENIIDFEIGNGFFMLPLDE